MATPYELEEQHHKETCSRCFGDGVVLNHDTEELEDCATCDGHGYTWEPNEPDYEGD